jgi:CrcB protein
VLGYIVAGGALGTIARWGLQGLVQERLQTSFPAGTLIINLAGSFAVGFLIRIGTATTIMSPELRAGVTVGFCGAFTTMSTFGYEAWSMLGAQDYVRAALYMAATLAGSIVCVGTGIALANRIL